MRLILTYSCFLLSLLSASETTVIAFGSCAHQDHPLPILNAISQAQPQAFFWLGDAAYIDSGDPVVMKRKYNLHKQRPEYLQLTKQCLISGVWDDHDYGKNDAGKEWKHKAIAQQAFLDFLDVPAADPRRSRAGAYTAHDIGTGERIVRVILLDARYHRDRPGATADVLGQAQWTWLEQQLTNSPAQVHILGSGIQVLSDQHPWESWGKFPAARQRLLELIAKTKVKAVVCISGDRHITELSKQATTPFGYPLYDLTSSGMNRGWKNFKDHGNKHRVGTASGANNAGLISINWSTQALTLQSIDQDGQPLITQQVPISELQ